jgi:hypothetical protein
VKSALWSSICRDIGGLPSPPIKEGAPKGEFFIWPSRGFCRDFKLMGGEGMGLFERKHVHPVTLHLWMALLAVTISSLQNSCFVLLLNADC